MIDFYTLRYFDYQSNFELFSFYHHYDPDYYGYRVTLQKFSQTCLASTAFLLFGYWNKLLISLYSKPFSTNPWTQCLHILVYIPILDEHTPIADMGIQCPLDLALTTNTGYFQIGGITHFDSADSRVHIRDILIAQSARLLFHEQQPLAAKECYLSIQLHSSDICWLCAPGFIDDDRNQCQNSLVSCPDGYTFNPDMRKCERVCLWPCKTCLLNGDCLSCFDTHDLVGTECQCRQGQYLGTYCPPSQTQDTLQVDTFYSFGLIYQIDGNTGIRQFTYEIKFRQPFQTIPEVVIAIIYLDATGRLEFSFEATAITQEKFTIQVFVKGDTRIKNFGIKYMAYVVPPSLFESGYFYLPYDSPLSEGTGLRSYEEVISLD